MASFHLLSKAVLFTKLAMSLLLAKYARFNLTSKTSVANFLYSGVVIYYTLVILYIAVYSYI